MQFPILLPGQAKLLSLKRVNGIALKQGKILQ